MAQLTIAVAVACSFGCTGIVSGPDGTAGANASVLPPGGAGAAGGLALGGGGLAGSGGIPGEVPACAPSPRRVRRLSHEEYENVVTDLLGARPALLGWSTTDVLVHGFDTNAEALTVSSGNFDDYALAAELVANAADVTTLAPCPGGEAASCAARFAASFGERAYGRSLSVEEQARLADVYASGASSGAYADGVRATIEALLLSPHFIYRTELGMQPEASATVSTTPLTSDEVASSLSFAITGSRPDATLRARARSDASFLTPGVLAEEASRLAATPAARARLERLLRSWLGVRDLREVNKIPAYFPVFNPLLKADLDRELSAYVAHALTDGGGTLEALLGGSSAFPSQTELQAIYAGDYAPGATPVLPAAAADGSPGALPFVSSFRRGVLSLPSWLAAHAPVHRSSPVDRGLAIRSRFFCQTLQPPPPGVLATAPAPGDATTTTRQRFEMHAKAPACQACHSLMDPIGFGFEMMDGMGHHRDTENGLRVDSSGVLTGTDVDGAFQGPAELADKLLLSRQVRDCFVVQAFRYIEGRDESASDACRLERAQSGFAAPERLLSDLTQSLALDEANLSRSFEP